MNRQLTLVLIVFCMLGLGLFHQQIKKPYKTEENEHDKSGSSRQQVTLQNPVIFKSRTLDGELFDLGEYLGKRAVIINFFTTWCGPCRREMPELIQFYKANQDKFIMVGIDVNESKGKTAVFRKQFKIPFPLIADERGEIARKYRVKAFPTTIGIDAEGKIDVHQIGMIRSASDLFSDFNMKSKEPVKLEQIEEDIQPPGRHLTGRALEFADNFVWPDTGVSLLESSDPRSLALKEKLMQIDVHQLSDSQIMVKLFSPQKRKK